VKTYTAELQLETVAGDSLAFNGRIGRQTMRLDSGPDVTSPNPVEAVLAAIGACSAMDVIEILRKMRQQVTAYRVDVSGERRDEHPRIFTRIEIVHRLRGRGLKPAAIERAIELSDTKYCSVHAMLRATVTIESRYEIEPEPARGPA
jgi:putative redox protein